MPAQYKVGLPRRFEYLDHEYRSGARQKYLYRNTRKQVLVKTLPNDLGGKGLQRLGSWTRDERVMVATQPNCSCTGAAV